jgi:hypothetical protein
MNKTIDQKDMDKKPIAVFGLLDDPSKKIINEEIKQKKETQSLLG